MKKREWTFGDFNGHGRPSILDTELYERLSTGYIARVIAKLFVEMHRGKWGGRPPQLSDVAENGFLFGENYDEVWVHRDHPKFGNNIVEGVFHYIPTAFVFFDFENIGKVFDALLYDLPMPAVPTYDAQPEDRCDYQDWHKEWEDSGEDRGPNMLPF